MKVEPTSVVPVYVSGNLSDSKRLLPLYFDLIPMLFKILWWKLLVVSLFSFSLLHEHHRGPHIPVFLQLDGSLASLGQ